MLDKQKEQIMKINKKHLDTSKYSRSKIPLERLTGLVIHFTDSATHTFSRDINWLYDFLNYTRPRSKKYASYHYAIDQDGEAYEFIPPDECAWHAGPTSKTAPEITEMLGGRPNWSTIGISFLHPKPNGKPTEATYESLVNLSAYLIHKHNIPMKNIIRHYDCTGKMCPRYYVKNEDEWKKLQEDIRAKAFILSGGYE